MAAPVRVRVTHTYSSDPQTVFDALSRHENLERVFYPAKITRISDESRRLKIGPLPSFVETTTVSEPPSLIEYRITQGSPLTDHHGIQRLTPTTTGGTRLDYTIAFDSKIPGVARIVGVALTQTLKRNLKKLVP